MKNRKRMASMAIESLEGRRLMSGTIELSQIAALYAPTTAPRIFISTSTAATSTTPWEAETCPPTKPIRASIATR